MNIQSNMLTLDIPTLKVIYRPPQGMKDTIRTVGILLDQLRQYYAEAGGAKIANAWRDAITGICLSEDGTRVTCIEYEDDKQDTGDWLVRWLNAELDGKPERPLPFWTL